MDKSQQQQDGGNDQAALASLSPFELKDELIKAAGGGAVERPANLAMLNAGRGNPNFLATTARHGFWQLGLFAMREAERSFAHMPEGVGGFPKRDGLSERFELFLRENRGVPGIDFLRGAVSYVRDQLGLSDGDFLYEIVLTHPHTKALDANEMVKQMTKHANPFAHQQEVAIYKQILPTEVEAVWLRRPNPQMKHDKRVYDGLLFEEERERVTREDFLKRN